MDLTHLSASNGVGEPVRATVTVLRTALATVLSVDSLTNWPQNFICTTGKLQSNGTLDPTTVNVFSGHISGTQIAIDSFAPGYTDKGNSVGDVAVIKPTTLWADSIASAATQMNTFTQTQGDWRTISTVPTLNATNGQREYVLKYANTDLTGSLGNGMRLQIPRTVTPPTQSMAFTAASSQYATKASPTGITFTTAFSCEAWIYLNSYQSNNQAIISRWDGTNGFIFFIQGGDGRLGINGSGTYQLSAQSMPLQRWVHVAATYSAGTMNLYINGILVPSIKTGTGTSMTQGGSLQVGAYNSAGFFDGSISEGRLWSAAQTQAQIQANMGISCTGSETNLVFLAQGNGNFNDKTSNANNLTATNGAIATQAANPYNATEYAIVTNVTKSGIDTLVTVFLPTGTSLPNATLGTTKYSIMRTPYGFPSDISRWSVTMPINTNQDKSAGLARWILQNPNGINLVAPTGAWKVKASLFGVATFSVGQTFNQVTVMVSKATSVDTTSYLPFSRLYGNWTLSVSSNEVDSPTLSLEDYMTFSSQTPLYVLVGSPSPNISLIRIAQQSSVTLESAYV